MSLFGSTFAYQDDTYILHRHDKTRDLCLALGPSLDQIGCKANIRKSGVWCSARIDPNQVAIPVLDEPPLVMKQPLSIFLKSCVPDFEVT